MDLIKFKATWRNQRIGESVVAMHIYYFLMAKALMERTTLFFQWIEVGCESNHHPIFIEVNGNINKLGSPFKFNASWLKYTSFHNIVSETWVPFNLTMGDPVAIQFVENLKKVKKEMIHWSIHKRQ